MLMDCFYSLEAHFPPLDNTAPIFAKINPFQTEKTLLSYALTQLRQQTSQLCYFRTLLSNNWQAILDMFWITMN